MVGSKEYRKFKKQYGMDDDPAYAGFIEAEKNLNQDSRPKVKNVFWYIITIPFRILWYIIQAVLFGFLLSWLIKKFKK